MQRTRIVLQLFHRRLETPVKCAYSQLVRNFAVLAISLSEAHRRLSFKIYCDRRLVVSYRFVRNSVRKSVDQKWSILLVTLRGQTNAKRRHCENRLLPRTCSLTVRIKSSSIDGRSTASPIVVHVFTIVAKIADTSCRGITRHLFFERLTKLTMNGCRFHVSFIQNALHGPRAALLFRTYEKRINTRKRDPIVSNWQLRLVNEQRKLACVCAIPIVESQQRYFLREHTLWNRLVHEIQ